MKIFIAAITLVTTFYVPQLFAAPPKPVPLPVLTLVNPAGEQVSTEGLGKDKGVVLLLVRKGNPGGEKLLSLLEEASDQFPAERFIVVVGGGDEKSLKVVAEKHRNVAATWYCDSGDLLSKELKLKGTPAVVGIGDGMVAWSIPGSNDLEFMEKTIRGWLYR